MPEKDTVRTLLRPRVARYFRSLQVKIAKTSRPATGQASQRGVIQLTFTA